MTVERKPGEALWSQIAEALAGEIAAGAYRDDPRLPTETLLAARFGVNRHTIRRALLELANAGLIRTEHGRGSFAADAVLDYRIGQRPRFSEWVRGHRRTPLGRILRLEDVELAALEGEAAAVAAALEIEAGARVIVFERVGTADALAVSLSRHIFPADRVAGLLAALRAHGSVTAALASIGVADYTRTWTRVSARLPDAREAGLLRMARTAPLLATESLNVAAGRPVEYGIARYPAARVQLVFDS